MVCPRGRGDWGGELGLEMGLEMGFDVGTPSGPAFSTRCERKTGSAPTTSFTDGRGMNIDACCGVVGGILIARKAQERIGFKKLAHEGF